MLPEGVMECVLPVRSLVNDLCSPHLPYRTREGIGRLHLRGRQCSGWASLGSTTQPLGFSAMVKPWLVWLELARDDGAPLSDEGITELTDLLTQDGVKPELNRKGPGTMAIRLTLPATNDMAARSAAEETLRDRAQQVWTALGLPPFTIAFVETKLESE